MGNYVARALIDNYYKKPSKNKNKQKNTFLATFNKESKEFDYRTGVEYKTNQLVKKEKND